jgi:hypothetical protein
MAFTDLCERCNAIGFWNGEFIQAGYLVRPDPLLSERELRELNWAPAQMRQAERLMAKMESISLRLKGYAGWLVTDPDFRQARDELASRWAALPDPERPFPIVRSIKLDSPPEETRAAGERVSVYQGDLNAFLDRWGLTKMLSWDLPEPQGPMLPSQLPLHAPAMPKHGLHFVLPLHYPLTGSDFFLQQIRQQQIQLAKENGLDPSMAGLPHFEVYGQMLEVDLLEMTMRSRYDRPGRRRGLVTALEFSIAETLGLSVDQVRKLRKGISACRRGKRSSVRWLKTDVS